MKNKPKYWYKQSAVIPFRKTDEKLEILLVTTRKKRKWIIPKGIVEEALTSRESATKEAFEEAGIIGELIPKKLGKYSYKKWGGNCKVKVYALRVDSILDSWEEDFRERKWIDILDVEKYIENVKLLEIIKSFYGYA